MDGWLGSKATRSGARHKVLDFCLFAGGSCHYGVERLGTLLYNLACVGTKAIVSVAAKTHILRSPGTAGRGPFLFVSNHISHFDPPILSARSPWPIDWMADAVLFSTWWSGPFMRGINTFPVDRVRPDKASLQTALQRLKQGRPVGIFPEGGIRDGGRSVLRGAPLKPGFAAIAQLARVPLVPAVILGTDRLYNKNVWIRRGHIPVWIGIGEEIRPDYSGDRTEIRECLARTVAEALRKVLADLRAHFPIGEDDLPKSPQERMREP